ncbi:hypothetical protein Clacol_002961 [Clathrus columnatus]|uniref:Uncharacterized protein n=1 Tax=Clathrus columnatus TaxID=1419009 RepID=A0AAV5A5I1_9AGAM|nr:hypothetical protein Clacol_002961 [Clathrus columnatus]
MPFSRSEQTARDIPFNRTPVSPNARLPTHSGPQQPTSNYYQYHQSVYSNTLSEVDRYTRNDREDDKCTLSATQSFEGRPNDEDCVSFFSSPTPTPMDPNSDGSDSETGPQIEDDNLTTFGPKMRFVSPPPWESHPGDSYDDEDDNVSLSDGFSVFSGRFASRKYRHQQEKVSIRSLALASMRTPSPTPTTSSRRNPYGGAYPKESQSQISLSINQPGEAPWNSRSTLESSSSERPSFSFSFRDKIPSSNLPIEFSSKQRDRIQHSPLSQDDVTSVFRSDSPVSLGPYTHPYANPDVTPIISESSMPSRKDINPTGIHQQQRQSNESDPGYVRRASESAAVTTTHAASSLAFRKGSAGNLPTSHPRSSSKPALPSHDENDMTRSLTTGLSPARSPHSPQSLVPFPDSPMNNLLTLEEAQRIKKSSTPGSPIQTRFTSGSTLVAGVGLSPGVKSDFEVKRNQPLSPSDTSSTIRETKTSNARQRTISTSKLSILNSSPSQDDVGSSNKSLKHKRSGFMKLFGKDKDVSKEPPSPNYKTTIPFTEPIPPVPKRVSPPSLSVVVTSPSVFLPEIEKITLSQQKSPPPSEHDFPASPSVSSKPLETDRLQDIQPSESRPIFSAPPSQTTFEGLSLRPVSTVFSAKFSELFSTLDQSEPLVPPVMPAASNSSGGGGSPTRSDFSSRSNSSDYPLTPSSTTIPGTTVSIAGRHGQEDTIVSLQAQLANMQKNHQRQIWELEGQIKDLKQENETFRNSGTCESCGRSKREGRLKSDATGPGSIVDRPRPKVGKDARSVFGGN